MTSAAVRLILKEQTDWLEEIDVICWDECDSIFDFATQAFVRARTTDFARKEVSNAEVLAVIQDFSTKKEYMPLILLGAWEHLIEDGRIMCIGLSASPERAYMYYKSLVSASYQGKLEVGYRAAHDIYFCNVIEHVSHLTPELNKGYWCYSPLIERNQRLVEAARNRGFNAIEIHSPNNINKPMTEEQLRVYNMIVATGLVPAEYLNQWIPVDKCRLLAEYMNVPEMDKQNRGRIMTWNKLKDYLPTLGYKVEQKRKRLDGKLQTCYYITGEWHDVVVDDNDFLQLVDAKIQLEQSED